MLVQKPGEIMIKLILSDMDGTLLDDNGNMPADFDEVMGLLRERGVRFVPASGRQYTALMNQFGKYEKEFAFIAENGSFGMDRGEEFYSGLMDKTAVRHVLEKLMNDGEELFPALCGKRCAFLTPNWEPYLDFMGEFFTSNQIVDDIFAVIEQEDIVKMAFCDCREGNAEDGLYSRVVKVCPLGTKVALSSNYWVDVLNSNINKGTALRVLQLRLGILPEECLAFGDYLNDIEMLTGVKYGYAMANAHPDVIRATRFTAPANNKNGVMRTIRRLIDEGLI